MVQQRRPNRQQNAEGDIPATNVILIGWILTIYGIFWGVWLAFFAGKLITECDTEPLREILTHVEPATLYPAMLIGLSIMIATYSYFLVKWLWSIRTIIPGTPYGEVFTKLWQAIFFLVFTVSGMSFLSWSCNIVQQWTGIGGLITLGWIIVVCFVVLVDKENWT